MSWRRVLTDKRQLILPIAVVLIANAALLVLVVYPLSQRVAGGERQAEAVAAELDAARKDYAAARATVTGKESADKALQQFYSSVLPPDLSGARRIFDKVDPLLRESNLRRSQASQRPETRVRGSDLGKLTLVVDFSGNYPEIRRFLHALETSPEFVVIENVELLQEGEGKSGINVTVQVATYYRTSGNGN